MMRYFSSYKVMIKVIEYKKTGLQVSKIAGHLVGKSQEVNIILTKLKNCFIILSIDVKTHDKTITYERIEL